jgi:spore germination protein YaaH
MDLGAWSEAAATAATAADQRSGMGMDRVQMKLHGYGIDRSMDRSIEGEGTNSIRSDRSIDRSKEKG